MVAYPRTIHFIWFAQSSSKSYSEVIFLFVVNWKSSDKKLEIFHKLREILKKWGLERCPSNGVQIHPCWIES